MHNIQQTTHLSTFLEGFNENIRKEVDMLEPHFWDKALTKVEKA